jgi:uncharacterized membrane protein YhiD involved in acid resistance
MRIIASFLFLALLASFSPVQANPNQNAAQRAAQKAYAEKKRKQKEERERKAKINQQVLDYIAGRDKNNDKSLTLEEFATGESNAEAAAGLFKLYNKNNDRYLSKTEVKELLGLE